MSRKNIIFLLFATMIAILLLGRFYYINQEKKSFHQNNKANLQEQKNEISIESIFQEQEKAIKQEEIKIQKIADETEINPKEDDAKTIVEKLDRLNKDVDDILK